MLERDLGPVGTIASTLPSPDVGVARPARPRSRRAQPRGSGAPDRPHRQRPDRARRRDRHALRRRPGVRPPPADARRIAPRLDRAPRRAGGAAGRAGGARARRRLPCPGRRARRRPATISRRWPRRRARPSRRARASARRRRGSAPTCDDGWRSSTSSTSATPRPPTTSSNGSDRTRRCTLEDASRPAPGSDPTREPAREAAVHPMRIPRAAPSTGRPASDQPRERPGELEGAALQQHRGLADIGQRLRPLAEDAGCPRRASAAAPRGAPDRRRRRLRASSSASRSCSTRSDSAAWCRA